MDEWEKGYSQGWHDAMDMVIAEAQLWENENNRSLSQITLDNIRCYDMLTGARDEIKGFKERINLVLKTRGPKAP